jgi:hypothetical protein
VIPIGIVGAGRTRFGLGPVLAQCAERAGMRVDGVAGRCAERARANARELADSLGHAIRAHDSVAALCASPIDALIVASPPQFHLHALEAALAAGLAVLCEKPLVHEMHIAIGEGLVARFAERAVPLVENCQWPFVLRALAPLAPWATARTVELGLEPPRAGRELIANSLSHLLSVLQAAMPIDAATTIDAVRLEPPVLDGRATTLRFVVEGERRIEAALHVALREGEAASPWLAFDGERLDRRTDARFDAVFSGRRGSVTVPEPVQARVDAFAALVCTRDRDRMASELAGVRERLRLYRDVLACIA